MAWMPREAKRTPLLTRQHHAGSLVSQRRPVLHYRTDELAARLALPLLPSTSPSRTVNALNESNPKTLAWLRTWKLISNGNPPKFLSKNFLPNFPTGQLLHRVGSPIDHRPLEYRSLDDTRPRQPVNFPTDALHRPNSTDSIVQLSS